ncbi:hypothetical protein [Leuconostoc mesenteroides]|nr:hypothetical protein [Leuconostoc mesenteroides]
MTIVTGEFFVVNCRTIDFENELIKCKRNLNRYVYDIERKLL